LPKNYSTEDLKPNGSELSYLLYYASNRHSKLSKVGAFLERKTHHDLSKSRIAPVQITLQILTAFLNNPGIGGAGPQGFGLFAPFVLRILRDVLVNAHEAILIESAVQTWDTFCRHQDYILLNADSDFRKTFIAVIKQWAGYASNDKMQDDKTDRRGGMKVGHMDRVKLRMAGLEAIKSTADSDTLGHEVGNQLATVIPVILQNLYYGNGDFNEIMKLSNEMEIQEKEKAVRSRPSMMTMRESMQEEADARAAGATTDEADVLADRDASVLALKCLKSCFTHESRSQIRIATACVLSYVAPRRSTAPSANIHSSDINWTIQLFEAICNWISVQDRFVAIFTIVEILVGSPILEQEFDRQVLLTRIVSTLLASQINFIGLSVMDVLLALLHHITKIQKEADANSLARITINEATPQDMDNPVEQNLQITLSPIRMELLAQLQKCIANLAVHVYYTDQISDMIFAIIIRLKAASSAIPQNSLLVSSRKPVLGLDNEDVDSPALSEVEGGSSSSGRGTQSRSPQNSLSFSTPAARVVALNAVTKILIRTNQAMEKNGSYVSTHRNAVPITVWQGSHWLLRDHHSSVRLAYIEALRTWMQYEMPKLDLKKYKGSDVCDSSEVGPKSPVSPGYSKRSNVYKNETAILQNIHLVVVDIIGTTTDSEDVRNNVDSSTRVEDNTLMAEKAFDGLRLDLERASMDCDLMPLEEFRNSNPPSMTDPGSQTLSNNVTGSFINGQQENDKESKINQQAQGYRQTSLSTSLNVGNTKRSIRFRDTSSRQDFASSTNSLPRDGTYTPNVNESSSSPQVDELRRILEGKSQQPFSAGLESRTSQNASLRGRDTPNNDRDSSIGSRNANVIKSNSGSISRPIHGEQTKTWLSSHQSVVEPSIAPPKLPNVLISSTSSSDNKPIPIIMDGTYQSSKGNHGHLTDHAITKSPDSINADSSNATGNLASLTKNNDSQSQNGSDSMIEVEGSWAATSLFLMPASQSTFKGGEKIGLGELLNRVGGDSDDGNEYNGSKTKESMKRGIKRPPV